MIQIPCPCLPAKQWGASKVANYENQLSKPFARKLTYKVIKLIRFSLTWDDTWDW